MDNIDVGKENKAWGTHHYLQNYHSYYPYHDQIDKNNDVSAFSFFLRSSREKFNNSYKNKQLI